MPKYGLGVYKLDLNVLLLDAWELAVEFIVIRELSNVESGREHLRTRLVVMSTAADITAMLVEVVEKTEQRAEGCRRVVANEGSRKQRHLA